MSNKIDELLEIELDQLNTSLNAIEHTKSEVLARKNKEYVLFLHKAQNEEIRILKRQLKESYKRAKY